MHSHWRDCKQWEDEDLKLSTCSNEASKLFDAVVSQYVGWYDDHMMGGLGQSCEQLLAADTEFVMGKVVVFGLDLLGTGKSTRTDATFKHDVENLFTLASVSNITPREQLHVKAIKQWADGLLPEASRLWESILLDHPHDMLAAKFAHDTYFYLGQSFQMRDSIAHLLPLWKRSQPLYGYLHGMYAFGLEETNIYTEAEKHSLMGLELNKRDAWATHALAHVYEMTGQQSKGIRMMLDTEADWSSCGMLACHNYWHLALYYLDKGDYDTVLSIYDSKIKNRFTAGALLDLVDASSLLYRLELENVDVKERWKDVNVLCKRHLKDHVLVFNDAHFIMSFLRNYDTSSAEALLSTMKQFIDSFTGHHQANVAKNVGYDLCQAFIAYDEGKYETAVDILYPIRYKIVDIGGSHAQRDVFNLLLINAALKSPSILHKKLAKILLTERKMLKENSSLTDRLIARSLACH